MKQTQPKNVFRWALGYLRPYRGRIALFLVVTVVEILSGLLLPWPMKFIVDNVLGNQPMPGWLANITGVFGSGAPAMLVLGCTAYLVFHYASEFISVAHTQMQQSIGQRLIFDLRQELFAHLQSLSLRDHLRRGPGETIYHIENDSYCVESLTMGGLLPLAGSTATLGAMFCVLLGMNWQVALLSLLVVPFLYWVNNHYSNRIVDASERVKMMEGGVINLFHEVFTSIRVVKAFGRESHEQQRFKDQGSATLDERIKLTLQESLYAAMINVVTTGGTSLILLVGGYFVYQKRMTIGDLLVALTYLASVFGPLVTMSHTFGTAQASVASARRVLRTLQTEPELHDQPNAVEAGKLRGQLELRDVQMQYDDGAPVLRGVSFQAKPGQMIALVGLTGAGKTTLVSLIPRFYDPNAGQVLIDGRDVRDYKLRSLRDQVSIVLQEPVLFSGTIADNIRYGRLEATDEEVIAAAKAAYAHDFITRKEDGYQTRIGGYDGIHLSGGERQRISIARAFLKNAPILILDEPTSSLDARAESSIFESLAELMAHRTTIVIAHRLSTVRDADKILVLDGGHIIGEGRHEELLMSVPLYRELCARLAMGNIPNVPDQEEEFAEAEVA
ncbi:MAG TPA: ABC transporter ATP-binding protein [Blastocatellia bacterium]|nr:ABC transporter ATP-binding protein [Blastocatellia bacterium]HMX28219.1 ABC transporter ATP-binding protein [Blastocatellia bacterium]HMY75163.1 ABC transporter ATP-binding protein [Blastocatellia bacterium]HMZ21538.1 ABC transporter ATP-binding protein [Blastocatellia bacterium]HNG30369.1 ABC transporter ATP-binding protein [Blastocatellia bacterium]